MHSYLRQDIYGYRDCRGNEFHFFEGKSYQLVNPGESIRIYRIFQQKGKQQVASYFFTRELSGLPKPLTLENLSADFSKEPLFLEKLYLLAKNDFQLIRHLYAINRARINALQSM